MAAMPDEVHDDDCDITSSFEVSPVEKVIKMLFCIGFQFLFFMTMSHM